MDQREGGVIAGRGNVRRLAKDERGAAAIEYGLIASLIIIAIVGSLTLVGSGVMQWWDKISAAM